MTDLTIHDSAARTKRIFVPIDPNHVRLYVCGPTVYDLAHLGNARPVVVFDVLARLLRRLYPRVTYVRNITDVDDKINARSRESGEPIATITSRTTADFHADMAAIGALPPDVEPRATAHIPQMIRIIEELIANGHAYAANGNVFFDVTSFDRYGALSGNTLDKLKVGARLEEHPDKRNPWDFALWLKAPEGHLMRWPSPWSEGYPGWHIECSAMSQEYLGDSFDIHTGGEDNIFPHHEAEIAQSECATGKPFVRYWLHTRHILIDGVKMSKSKGNFYRLSDIVEHGFSPTDLRVCFLGAHYRSQMNFTWDSLEQARKIKESLLKTFGRVATAPVSDTGLSAAPWLTRLIEACEDDLNTPLALTIAQELARETNSTLDRNGSLNPDIRSAFDTILFLFGLEPERKEAIPDEIQKMATDRQKSRIDKDFTEADRLRDAILKAGYTIEDTPNGPQITRGK